MARSQIIDVSGKEATVQVKTLSDFLRLRKKLFQERIADIERLEGILKAANNINVDQLLDLVNTLQQPC